MDKPREEALKAQLRLLEGAQADPLWEFLRQYLEAQGHLELQELLKALESQGLPQASLHLGKYRMIEKLKNLPAVLASEIKMQLNKGGPT